MKHRVDMIIKKHEDFGSIHVERLIDIELLHDGKPVEIIPATWETIHEEYPWTKRATHKEEYMTRSGSKVFRGLYRDEEKGIFETFAFEKVF